MTNTANSSLYNQFNDGQSVNDKNPFASKEPEKKASSMNLSSQNGGGSPPVGGVTSPTSNQS